MPNPLVVIRDLVAADADNLPANTEWGAKFPTQLGATATDVPKGIFAATTYVQYGWDGTPSDADNRENSALRITVWTMKGKATDAQDVALGLRYRLLNGEHDDAWRVDRGAGRVPGTDPDTSLPFCTFGLNLALHAPA